jgi:ParB family chromosome partitioning protein
MKRKALGKGLESLIPKKPPVSAPAAPIDRKAIEPASGSVLEIDLDRIRPNRSQPRQRFDPVALTELAASLESTGVIQPVVVRRTEDGFELIAGERRWRAAQQAGLLRIPAVVRDVPDDKLLEVALIENVQREELNAIEEAQAYRMLMDELDLSQAEIADRVGKNRATIANALRLLTLAKKVQDRVRDGAISAGHARALAALGSPKDQVALAEKVESQGLSVRDVERLVARAARAGAGTSDRKSRARRDPNVEAAEEKLQSLIGTKVRIVQGSTGSGRVELHFYSGEELLRLYDVIESGARNSG